MTLTVVPALWQWQRRQQTASSRSAWLVCGRWRSGHQTPPWAGGEIALRITTSSLPSTTNCDPSFSLSFFRIFSGMTTCPLEDILVVARFGIVLLLNSFILTGKIIIRLCADSKIDFG